VAREESRRGCTSSAGNKRKFLSVKKSAKDHFEGVLEFPWRRGIRNENSSSRLATLGRNPAREGKSLLPSRKFLWEFHRQPPGYFLKR